MIANLARILDRFLKGKPTKGPMFPASNGEPFRLNNLLRQQILPALNRCLHCGVTELKHRGTITSMSVIHLCRGGEGGMHFGAGWQQICMTLGWTMKPFSASSATVTFRLRRGATLKRCRNKPWMRWTDSTQGLILVSEPHFCAPVVHRLILILGVSY